MTRCTLKFAIVVACVAIWSLTSLSAAARQVPPEQANVLRVNGQQIAIAPMAEALELGSSFTMEAWIYPVYVEPLAVILGKPNDTRHIEPWMDYTIGIADTGDRFEFQMSSGQPGTYRAVASDPLHLNEWTHIAVVHGAGTMRLVVNGQTVASTESPGVPSNDTLPFGVGAGAQQDGSVIGGFDGALAQVRVWNRALSDVEIESGLGMYLTGSEVGLVAYWPLDDSDGLTARDLAPSGLHLAFGKDQSSPRWQTKELLGNPVFEFSEVNASEILTSPSWLRLMDFDSDGDLDVVMTQIKWPASYPNPHRQPLIALRNDGTGHFEDATNAVFGGATSVHARAFAMDDFNGDGLTDLFIADHGTDVAPFPGEPNGLFLQTPEGIFDEVSDTHLPEQHGFSHSTAAADIDGDGDVDIYVGEICCGSPDFPELYLNDGNGVFTSTTAGLPVEVRENRKMYLSAAFFDSDKDGDADLFLGGWSGPDPDTGFQTDALLINDGSGTFSYAPDGTFPPRLGGSGHGTIYVAQSDFDGDGWPDLMLSNHANYQDPGLQLVLNNGDGTFRDATERISQEWPEVTMDFDWLEELFPRDFNGDGWMDLLVESGSRGAHLFLNTGGGEFIDATAALLPQLRDARDAGDVDGDGDVDVFGNHNATAMMLVNQRPFLAASPPLPVPSAPVLMYPVQAGNVSGLVDFGWVDVVGATGYQIHVARDASFSDLVYAIRNWGPSGVSNPLDGASDYFWRVRAESAAGVSTWSETRNFSLVSGVARADEPNVPATYALHGSYPNPFQSHTTLRFETPETGQVCIRLYDVTGRQLATLVDGIRPAGSHQIEWNGQSLPPGVYFYRLIAGNMRLTRSVSKLR